MAQSIVIAVFIYLSTNANAKEQAFRNRFFDCEIYAVNLESQETERLKAEIFGCVKSGSMDIVIWDIDRSNPVKFLIPGTCTHLGKNVLDEILLEFSFPQHSRKVAFKLSPDKKRARYREALLESITEDGKKIRLELKCTSI